MSTARIPLEVEARIGPSAFDDLARVMAELGYEPRPSGIQFEAPGAARQEAEMTLTADQSIPPEAANVMLEAVSNWIR